MRSLPPESDRGHRSTVGAETRPAVPFEGARRHHDRSARGRDLLHHDTPRGPPAVAPWYRPCALAFHVADAPSGDSGRAVALGRSGLCHDAGMRPFRFLAEAVEVADGRQLAESARRAEAMGFDGLVFSDHLLDQLAPIPAMATVAAATERLRVGTFVLNNDLRHPAVLAQDLATVDVLSGGRLDVGIGAGWNEPEYRAIGIPFEPVGIRVGRLAEAIALLKGAFAGEP